MNRESVVFYKGFYEALKELDAEDKAAAYEAIVEYGLFGVEPECTGVVKALFLMAKPQIDQNNKRYENALKGGEAAKKKTQTEPKADPTRTQTEPKADPTRTQTEPTPYPNDNDNVNDNVNENEKRVSTPAPAHESAKKYGEYGWVKLTDSQHSKLCDDLGAEEVQRCIRYVDESAQSTGNKNKWRDWNLVIRKCSRDKWGFNATGARDRPKNKFCNFKQRDDDLDALAHKLATQGVEV